MTKCCKVKVEEMKVAVQNIYTSEAGIRITPRTGCSMSAPSYADEKMNEPKHLYEREPSSPGE
eukprot:338761-Amorphochlora_amoeboformis.AAC.1